MDQGATKQIVWVLSIMSKIPEISVGNQLERSISVPSNRSILTNICRFILTDWFIALLLFTFEGNSEKE